MIFAPLLILAMQSGGLPPLQFIDVASAPDGTVFAVDSKAIRMRVSKGVSLRSAAVRVTYSEAANSQFEQAARGYYVDCAGRTAAVISSVNTARGTKRISMERTTIEALDYRPFSEMAPAEKSTMEYICAAPL